MVVSLFDQVKGCVQIRRAISVQEMYITFIEAVGLDHMAAIQS